MATRDQWLAAGLAALAAEGEPGVRVDRLARRLGLTKGSFHHHFRGATDYRRALLERYERDQLAALVRLTEALRDTPAEQALAALPSQVAGLLDTDAERSVRAWGVADPAARAVQARVDAARLRFLRELWADALGDDRPARTAALVPHLIAIGASVIQPRLSPTELNEVYELLGRLVPGVRAASGDGPAA